MFDVTNAPDGDANIPSHTLGEVVVTPILMIVLSLVAVCLRFWVKKGILNKVTLDDWFLLITEILFVPLCAIMIYTATLGFGVHSDKLSDNSLYYIYLSCYIEQLIYMASTITLKISVSILVIRLTIERSHRLWIWGTCIFYILVAIAFIFFIIFQCHPISAFWIDNDGLYKECANQNIISIMAHIHTTIGLVTDTILTIIPSWIVWKLNLDRKTKFYLCIVLSLGYVASFVNMVRYAYIKGLASPGDNSFDYFNIYIVSVMEMGFGIIAISLATCRPLIRIISKAIPWLGLAQMDSVTDQPQPAWYRPQNTVEEHVAVRQERRSSEQMIARASTILTKEEPDQDIKDWREIRPSTS